MFFIWFICLYTKQNANEPKQGTKPNQLASSQSSKSSQNGVLY